MKTKELIPGEKYRYGDGETELIMEYISRGGRLLFFKVENGTYIKIATNKFNSLNLEKL
jgi:hypothetical protein